MMIAALATLLAPALGTAAKPNLVVILCDDLGYGDVSGLNPTRGKLPTPHIDRLMREGRTFTEAHSSSAVCTPTRYGLLTGRYNWRSRLQSGVLMGYDKPLIPADRLTLPALLKRHGYATACFGKWHLGMEVPAGTGTGPIAQGPTTRGFDTFFGISASLDMPPFANIENDRFTQAPTATKTWGRTGAAAPDFEAAEVLPTLARKAREFIASQAADRSKPFFLYLPLTSPHTPLVPTKEWVGKSGLGPYGDFVMQTDWAVGEVLAALDAGGMAEETLVIFTSDNGCAPYIGVDGLERKGHFPSADRRGYKADLFDGGHRIPFIARWPGTIEAWSRSDQLVCLTDLMATGAALVGAELPPDAGEDSVNLLPALTGPPDRPVRESVVLHSIDGKFAIREGKWKLELCSGSGGWSDPKDTVPGLPPVQLYDMEADVGETRNLQAQHPEVVARLTRLLEKIVRDGRSTPGPLQANDVAVDIRKQKRRER